MSPAAGRDDLLGGRHAHPRTRRAAAALAQATTSRSRRPSRAESDLAARKEALDADIDAILDEIDEVLETNAEEFVRGFVQKGGQ